ncbi:response regulator [Hymenobacter baengnokdamensis]|uniref:response regulator n=1 Tax=Hymenobacter baengnokdamensis TaxID=2615203 RepID=UPI0017817A65|nr:response regulator transcription factor [Hymenobacter baengnokdamensis]
MITPLALVEDQPAIRQALSTYFGAQPEFVLVSVSASVEELLAGLDAGGRPPRLVLSDVGLPGGLSGIEGIASIRARVPQVEVVLLTVYQEPERIFQALCAGAVGYLVKTTGLADLKTALLDVLAGGSPMSPAVARHVVRYFRPVERRPSPVSLTAREQQVVEAIEQGLSYKLIADRLGVSLNTVRSHIRAVYEKLEINSRAELMSRGRHWE